MTLDELKQANRRLQQENDKLRKEIHRLKARLALYEPADPKDLWATPEIHVREEFTAKKAFRSSQIESDGEDCFIP